MSQKRVFIGYGTRFGSTEEVAYRIAKILQEKGIITQIENLRKNKHPPSPKEFDGVLIASGMKIDKWTKEPKKYIRIYSDELKNEEKIFGIFLCSLLAVQDYEESIKRYIKKILENYNIPDNKNHIIYDAFGGLMDFSKQSKLGFLDRRALQMAAMTMEKESEGSFKYDPDGKNDFRDWTKIEQFANKFSELLLK